MAPFETKDLILTAGVVVTLVLGIWNAVANARSSRRTTFINTVTSQRVKWIEQLRKDIATFSGLTYTWCFSSLEDKPQEDDVLREIDLLRHLIKLRLNPSGGPDQEITKLLDAIPTLTHESTHDQLRAALEQLTIVSQALLKAEWDKVKKESHAGDGFSGLRRVAIVLSSGWLLMVFTLLIIEGSPFPWHKLLVSGLMPVAVVWGIWWIWAGFRRRDV
ncbi:MAG: hypothetical protein AW10_03023 [Candidatus Accumulibacter appositus]|uniref:Uncharacterized protein n=1 Tax=Candidatus Accumulibacter appositus TaxID=1454003 RepID=A0A011QI50_9PROT|nr:hypothetical protein [Accumulibacter sp.]EXI78499.1 MAG: hypothetical protein AW10_03023 [Candidatus Accumulibacter appositus]HRF05923.1 hypothetical protein [Accumulibacter sp.]